MRLTTSLWALAACTFGVASAKSSWSFNDATVSVQSKGTGEGGSFVKEKLSPTAPLSTVISLGSADTLKIILTTTENKSPKRPHQAFLTLREPATGLEESFPLNLKENGKAKVDLAQKDLPIQHLVSTSPLSATLQLASFGSSTPLQTVLFQLEITRAASDPPLPELPAPVRYKQQPEIHHIFRDDPKSPFVFISLIFSAAIFVTLPVLIGTWLTLGMNFNGVVDAFSSAPWAHGWFLGSIITFEFAFIMYYLSWSLFALLPVATLLGVVTVLTGSRALSEVQGRRLAGKR